MDDQRTSPTAILTLEDVKTTWKTPSKVLLFVVVIFAAATIALLTTTIVFQVQKNDLEAQVDKLRATDEPEVGASGLCLTERCTNLAADMLSNMNRDVDPCKNFFEYACGGWNERQVISEDVSSITVLSELSKNLQTNLKGLIQRDPEANEPASFSQVRNYYNACVGIDTVNALGAKPLTDMLDSLGGWPVLGNNPGGNWDEAAFDFENLWGNIRGQYGVDTIIALGVHTGIATPIYELAVGEPKFAVTQLDLRKKKTKELYSLIADPLPQEPENFGKNILLDEKDRQAYLQYMLDVLASLGASKTQAMDDMTKVLEFETTVAAFSAPYGNWQEFEFGSIKPTYPDIDWERVFELVLPSVVESEFILVTSPQYIKDVSQWLKSQESRVIANYMLWRLVSVMTPYLSEQIQENQSKFLTAIRATPPVSSSRWRECVDSVNQIFPWAIGRMYVDEYFSEDAREKTIKIIVNLHDAFKSTLNTNDWLQKDDKKAAAEKADAMKVAVGFPDWIKLDIDLDSAYFGLKFKPDEYFNNAVTYQTYTSQKEFSKILKYPATPTIWDSIAPATVNAFYSQKLNAIIFPAAILQRPVFDLDQPLFSNYGGIGMIIGQAVSHGFDNTGLNYDKDGKNDFWMSETSRINFHKKAKCITDQYSSFVMPENGTKLNEFKTEDENIDDNGGLRQAYKAYKDFTSKEPLLPGLNLTEDQTFFLSFAQVWCSVKTPEGVDYQIKHDTHSPGRYRVIGTLQNNEAFSSAFKCPAGTYMNPADKCKIW